MVEILPNTLKVCPQVYGGGADLGVPVYTSSYDMGKVVGSSHPIRYSQMRWVSKKPERIIPILNILGIFNPDCWILVIISIFCLSVFLHVAAKVATLYGARPSELEDIAFVPIRLDIVIVFLFVGKDSGFESHIAPARA